MTDLQKRTAQAIVNVFETGSVRGDYANVTVVAGDAGHLTYAHSRTTLASGNMFLLSVESCLPPGATHAEPLKPCVAKMKAKGLSLDHDSALRSTLRSEGK